MPAFAPKVSIVIPVYNGSEYLHYAIDSALAQTYPNIEVIVVNDGSSDGGATEAIALSYGARIRYLSKINGGVATALNAGIAAMTGEYFSWLSHDDTYPCDKIEKQVAFLDAREDREVVVYGDYTLMDAKGSLFHTVRLPHRPSAAMPYYLYIEQNLHGCTLLVPKSAFSKVGTFPLHLRTTQDYDLWVRMAMLVPFVHLAEVLAHARQHVGQGSRTLSCHKDEVRCFFNNNYRLLTQDWMRTTFGSGGLRVAYLGLLSPLARVGLYGYFWDAVRQSMVATQGLPLSRRLPAVGHTSVKGLGALVQAIAIYLLPSSAWRFKQKIRQILTYAKTLSNRYPLQEHFSRIYQKNIFGGEESRSGEGSSLMQTAKLRQDLPKLFWEFGIKSLLDAPCGDFHWLQHIDLGQIRYVGIDIVPELIEANRTAYGDSLHVFDHLNLVSDPLPTVDLILCRDCLVHLTNADVKKALANFKRSGATYLLATTFTSRASNEELCGCWRVLNLEKPPFSLPKPLRLIIEECTEGDGAYADKSLGLWRLADLC
ncbi:glycosyl transferase family 2 [Solidesulfovibrio fructosivorans JJ]]|uniref:Glycosyl transferase family 2 n=1 Tax=Solidesulfovibrio fructosivorans JJ] TaxID=596151 RepID=E1JXN9_SOLFR|nr:glycosyltransferase [Solidesulfovibrio fructosivorans]EFL50812.1 glycosyl transferase family 2 [Solidesulfovibrio fructosivorans JJ]]